MHCPLEIPSVSLHISPLEKCQHSCVMDQRKVVFFFNFFTKEINGDLRCCLFILIFYLESGGNTVHQKKKLHLCYKSVYFIF